jgi:hypothetical protein
MSAPAFVKKLLDAAATDETTGSVGPAQVSHCTEHAFYIEGSAGVASGVVEIEEASHDAFAGTWESVAQVTVLANECVVVRKSGAGLAFRARISTAIGSGTVTVTYIGSN